MSCVEKPPSRLGSKTETVSKQTVTDSSYHPFLPLSVWVIELDMMEFNLTSTFMYLINVQMDKFKGGGPQDEEQKIRLKRLSWRVEVKKTQKRRDFQWLKLVISVSRAQLFSFSGDIHTLFDVLEGPSIIFTSKHPNSCHCPTDFKLQGQTQIYLIIQTS